MGRRDPFEFKYGKVSKRPYQRSCDQIANFLRNRAPHHLTFCDVRPLTTAKYTHIALDAFPEQIGFLSLVTFSLKNSCYLFKKFNEERRSSTLMDLIQTGLGVLPHFEF